MQVQGEAAFSRSGRSRRASSSSGATTYGWSPSQAWTTCRSGNASTCASVAWCPVAAGEEVTIDYRLNAFDDGDSGSR
jgi:hypothetical protein